MIASYIDARDDIYSQLGLILPATVSIIGETLDVVYPGAERKDKESTSKYWARCSIQTVMESQANLRGNDLKTRYNSQGLVFVQIFGPKVTDGFEKALQLATLIKTAFRGKQTPNCVWFRNVRIQDNIPSENAWYRVNVVAEYTYDEIG